MKVFDESRRWMLLRISERAPSIRSTKLSSSILRRRLIGIGRLVVHLTESVRIDGEGEISGESSCSIAIPLATTESFQRITSLAKIEEKIDPRIDARVEVPNQHDIHDGHWIQILWNVRVHDVGDAKRAIEDEVADDDCESEFDSLGSLG